MTHPTRLRTLAPVLALALFAPAAFGADEVPTFKARKDQEKKFVSEVCVAILKAAHFTAKEQALEKYSYEEVKKGRTKLNIKGTYKGAVTNKVYTADIVVHIDTIDKDKWEVLRIDYSDNNNVPHSRKKLEALVKKFNRAE